MPQGKKNKGGRGRNNKKKKGAGHGKNSRQRPGAARTPARTLPSGDLPLRPEHALEGSAPNYQAFMQGEKTLHENYPTIYSRYKAATKRVFKYMQDNTPESLHGNRMTVNSLMAAADWMEENNFTVDPAILKDLKLSIRVRSRVARAIFGGGDSGHKHLLTVLVYCWGVMVSLQRAATKPKGIEQEAQENLSLADEDVTASRNRFEALNDEDMDDEETDETHFPSKRVPRPETEPEPMSLEELIESDDRYDITLFLLSMNELMGAVSQQFGAVGRQVVLNAQEDVPGTAIVEGLIEAATGTNMAIQQMQRLEMDFESQHPHLSTPYRVLSTFVLPEVIEEITKTVRTHGQKRCSEKEVSIFLGDCLECSFRSRSDPENKSEVIVQEFCNQYQISNEGTKDIENVFLGLANLFIMEIPVGQEVDMNTWMVKEFKSHDPNFGSHRWIPQYMNFIGGDRAIHHTLRLLQSFGTVVKNTRNDEQVLARKGFFGTSPWESGRSSKIHNDLDELLMADILPQWFLLCRNGILGKAHLPRQNEISPLWVCMKNFFDNPTRPVSWSCLFAVHAILTAVLETDKVESTITLCSQAAFEAFFWQLDKAADVKKTEVDAVESPSYKTNMALAKFLKNFGLPVFGDRAVWNPLCGGTLFSYIALFGNLEAGCCLIDDRAQLRMVLHLYHSLIVNDILERGKIPLLDILFDTFKNSRGIWEGPLPKKGQFVERFWVSFGSNRPHAADMAKKSREILQTLASSNQKNPFGNYRSDRRKLSPIEPSELATSFRRICNRDFHDVVDTYHTPEQRQHSRGSDHYTFAIQMNDTLDRIDEEQQLYSLNLPALGVYLEQFICSLSRIFQWDPILVSAQAQHAALGQDKRQGVAYMFAQYLLGALDFGTDPLNMRFFDVPQGLVSSEFMSIFFNKIDISQVIWFQAIQEED
ncbi:unnamed protein product [Cylindrotheca closterium]|uniref:DUF6604 domain-containing protein n=1 Tax=Cylindrotheca closterium TaxID=2856 RepID=A0AAD2CIE3_9STRA|nr:unnamed protein product [Cylindrotheca closterium]